MRPVRNQPIKFFDIDAEPPLCCNEDRYIAKMFDNDSIQWQFEGDPCTGATELVTDSTFPSGANWTEAGGATIAFGTAILPVGGSVEQSVSLTAGDWYKVEITVIQEAADTSQSQVQIFGFGGSTEFSAVTGTTTLYFQALFASTPFKLQHSATSGAGSIRITLASIKAIEWPVADIRNPDTGVFIENPTVTFYDGKYITWTWTPTSAAIAVGTVYIEVVNTCATDIEYHSENICIVEENDCDLLIGACGSYNDWGNGFLPVARLRAELMRGTGYQYPDRFTYQDSNGLFKNGYTRRNKQYMLKIDLCPEHVRDFIYGLAFGNEIGIREGTSDQGYYFLAEEPDDPVFADREKDLATITLTLVRKDVNELSVYEEECQAALPPVVIGTAEIQEAIETDTNELIQG